MENQNKDTIILYTYKYIWQDSKGRLCVKFITDVQAGHAKFQENIKNDSNIKGCYREYVNSVNMAYFGFTEVVKEMPKEEKEKEKDGEENETK